MEDWNSLSTQWLCRRARLLSDNGHVSRGLVYQLVAHHMQPDDLHVMHGLAELFALAGDGKRALAATNKMEQQGVSAADLALLRINAYLALGQLDAASALLTRYSDESEDGQ